MEGRERGGGGRGKGRGLQTAMTPSNDRFSLLMLERTCSKLWGRLVGWGWGWG